LRPHSVLSVVSDRRTPELSTLSLPGALPISLRLVAQHIGRREPGAVALGEALELAHDARGAEVVGVSQRAAAERRETEAEDGAEDRKSTRLNSSYLGNSYAVLRLQKKEAAVG